MIDVEAILGAYRAEGYARLGPLLGEDLLAPLRRRADELMLGQVRYEGLFFQKDSETGRYEDLEYGRGYQGPSLDYRKIEKLELDPLFRALIGAPALERIARAWFPGAVSIYRAMVFNKPRGVGTPLPWHQDAGRMWGLDRDPNLQVWIALDDVPPEAGCVEVLPGSHHLGLATPLGGRIPEPLVQREDADRRKLALPARAGEGLLLHNLVWHRSPGNHTDHPRRAFSVCYIDAATRCLRTRRAPRRFPVVFEALSPQSPGRAPLDSVDRDG